MHPNESKEIKKVPKPPSRIKEWEDEGIRCYYVRFHQPIPPGVHKEPVSEFYLKSNTNKYVVDSLTYTVHGLVYRAYGETNISPLANIMYVRTLA